MSSIWFVPKNRISELLSKFVLKYFISFENPGIITYVESTRKELLSLYYITLYFLVQFPKVQFRNDEHFLLFNISLKISDDVSNNISIKIINRKIEWKVFLEWSRIDHRIRIKKSNRWTPEMSVQIFHLRETSKLESSSKPRIGLEIETTRWRMEDRTINRSRREERIGRKRKRWDAREGGKERRHRGPGRILLGGRLDSSNH